MTRRCVIERWVQRKTDQKLIFNGNYTQIVFFCFQDTLSLCFILFIWLIWSNNMCKKNFDTHHCQKNATFAWKNSEKPWFWRFWHDVTVASYKVCFVLFWYQWTREGHSYPLVPHTWCFVNRFPRSWGAESAPPGCEMGPKSPALLGLSLLQMLYIYFNTKHTIPMREICLAHAFQKRNPFWCPQLHRSPKIRKKKKKKNLT